MRKSLSHRLAERAWTFIEGYPGNGAEFKGRSQDFPRCVRQNGLSLALTFFKSKGQGAHGDYLEALARGLLQEQILPAPDKGQSPVDVLVRRSLEAPPLEYRRLTRTVMTSALWFKRLSEAQW